MHVVGWHENDELKRFFRLAVSLVALSKENNIFAFLFCFVLSSHVRTLYLQITSTIRIHISSEFLVSSSDWRPTGFSARSRELSLGRPDG